MDPSGRDEQQTDLDKLVRAITNEFSLDDPNLPDAFFPAHLPVALIEVVFATRPTEPQASQGASAAFCKYFDLECHRADRWHTPARGDQYTISRFILDCRSLESEAMERAVFGAPSTFPGTDRSRAQVVGDAAEALRDAGVEVLQDVRDRLPVFIEKVLGPVGDGSELVRWLLMLSGTDRFVPTVDGGLRSGGAAAALRPRAGGIAPLPRLPGAPRVRRAPWRKAALTGPTWSSSAGSRRAGNAHRASCARRSTGS